MSATSIIRRVFMLKNLDSKSKPIGEDNESFGPLYGNYIELNDLDTPLEPETNQDVDFEPTIFNEPDNVKTGFIIIDDEDVTRDVVLDKPFFMKYVSCQMEVDINKKTENQAKMTKLSMEWKRLCKIKAKVQKCQSQSQY
ncbi:hypothetical protein Tco_0195177 [Tanacetum coccineum]